MQLTSARPEQKKLYGRPRRTSRWGDGIKVGLNGVVFVLLLKGKAEVAAVLNTNMCNSVSRKGGECTDEL